MRNDRIEAALAELEAVGIRGCVLNGRKHLKIRWQHNGAVRTIVVSKTTNNWFATKNVRGDIRRKLKADVD